MARKAKKKVEAPPPDADEEQVTDQESIHDVGGGEGDGVPMDTSGDDIPDIIDKTSGDEDEAHDVGDASKTTKDKRKKSKKEKKQQSTVIPTIPFMDTFYQLSSEESLDERSIAARDLIQHCFLSEGGVNYKDAAYALTRLMNGLCTGRAASRQGFASCLSSFLRVAHSTVLNGDEDASAMETMLKEDSGKFNQNGVRSTHQAMIVRLKLLSTTQFLPHEVKTNSSEKGQKKHGFGGKVKGIEERDHAFGRLFGISAVVRSGILGLNYFPSEVSSVRLPWWLCCIVWQRYTCICND